MARKHGLDREYDFKVEWEGKEYRCEAIVQGRYYPATGPTYSCGGTPEEWPVVSVALIPVVDGKPYPEDTRYDDDIEDQILAEHCQAIALEMDQDALEHDSEMRECARSGRD